MGKDIVVHTQDELDAAIRDHGDKRVRIIVDSDPGVTLRIAESGRLAELRVGSASVVEMGGSARVDWMGGSASVGWMGDSARVDWMGGSARVDWMGGSARVDWMGGSARMERAAGTSTVHLHDSATLTKAAPYVAVYLHSTSVTVDGGHVIDMTEVDENDPVTWCALYGVDIDNGHAITYKAVDSALQAGHSYITTTYTIGETITAEDWMPSPGCGHGLHTSPTPRQARSYFGEVEGGRFLECAIPLAELVVTGSDKCKSRTVRVLAEVDIDGEPVEATP